MTADRTPGNPPSDAGAVLRRAATLGAARDPGIAMFLAAIERDPANRSLPHVVSLMLDEYAEQQRLAPNHLAPPPVAEDLYDPGNLPDFETGVTTETGVPYGPRLSQNRGTTVLSGITGGGKTTLVLNLIVGTHRFVPRVATLVFDVKGDYACLASLNHPAVTVFRVRTELPLTLIAPPAGVSLDSWLATFATLLCEYRGLKKSRHVLLDALTALCRHFGVDRDPTRPWPSLHNVLDYLQQKRGSKFGKEAEYRDSLINELRGLLGDSGRGFDTCDGIDIESLLKPGSITVLQMENLPAPAQQLFISLTNERIIQKRIAAHVHNAALEVQVVLDEAQQVLSHMADSRSENGIAPLAVHLLRAREFGVGYIVVAHLLPEISDSVLSAARTMMIVGGLSDGRSIAVAGQAMNLSPEMRTMLPRLGRGQALVREIGEGDYTDAFLVNLDGPTVVKNAIDEPTRQRLMAPRLAAMPTRPSQPLTNYPSIMAELNTPWTKAAPASPPSPTAAPATGSSAAPVSPITPTGGVNPTATSTPVLRTDELDALLDATRHRDDWMIERRVRLNIADYKVLQRIVTGLQSKNFAIVHAVRLGRSAYHLIEVTDPGWRILGLARPPHYLGRGGFVHTVLIARVVRHLKANQWTQVHPEFPVGPQRHPVDVFGRSPTGVATALEVTLSTSNVVSNAVKTLSGPTVVQDLIFLSPLQCGCKTVETLVRADPSSAALIGQIQFRRVDEFLA